MIANFHGLRISLPEMRRRFPLSLKGAKLDDLIRVAQRLGFSARPVRLDMEHMGQLRLPCILHWDFNHFVVLSKIKGQRATVLDPARGERSVTLAEASAHFTGVALELAPTKEFQIRKAPPSITVRELIGPISGLSGA